MDRLKKIIRSLNETKLEDLNIYETKSITPYFDYAVIASASNSRQLLAAVSKLRKDAEEAGINVKGVEGLEGGLWVLLDFVDVIVNIFIEEERTKYDLDKLWRTLPQIDYKSLL
jgi:ribosome-associated protein